MLRERMASPEPIPPQAVVAPILPPSRNAAGSVEPTQMPARLPPRVQKAAAEIPGQKAVAEIPCQAETKQMPSFPPSRKAAANVEPEVGADHVAPFLCGERGPAVPWQPWGEEAQSPSSEWFTPHSMAMAPAPQHSPAASVLPGSLMPPPEAGKLGASPASLPKAKPKAWSPGAKRWGNEVDEDGWQVYDASTFGETLNAVPAATRAVPPVVSAPAPAPPPPAMPPSPGVPAPLPAVPPAVSAEAVAPAPIASPLVSAHTRDAAGLAAPKAAPRPSEEEARKAYLRTRKKLREIDLLEQRPAGELAANQKEKLSKKFELIAEIQRIGTLVPPEMREQDADLLRVLAARSAPVEEEEEEPWQHVVAPKKMEPKAPPPQGIPGMAMPVPERAPARAEVEAGWTEARSKRAPKEARAQEPPGVKSPAAKPAVKDPREDALRDMGIEMNGWTRNALGQTKTLEAALELIFS